MKTKLSCLILLIFFFLSVSNLNSQYLHAEKLKLKKYSITFTDTSKITLTEKSPLLAGSLSFIVPGLALGQFYNEQYFKGILHIGISGLGFFLFISSIGPEGNSKTNTRALTGFLIFLTNWLYTTFDAMYSAEQINKQIKRQKYRSDIFDKLMFGLTLDKNKNLNLKFAFQL